jgi:hypothetical protein
VRPFNGEVQVSPSQLRNELARRILNEDDFDPAIPQLLGVDLQAATRGEKVTDFPPLPGVDDDEVYRGVVEFELQVSVMGRMQTFDCRAIYSTTLVNDGSIMALCMDVLGECEVAYQRLLWEPAGSSRWVPLDAGDLLAPDTRRTIEAMILHDALDQQEAGE